MHQHTYWRAQSKLVCVRSTDPCYFVLPGEHKVKMSSNSQTKALPRRREPEQTRRHPTASTIEMPSIACGHCGTESMLLRLKPSAPNKDMHSQHEQQFKLKAFLSACNSNESALCHVQIGPPFCTGHLTIWGAYQHDVLNK